MNKRFNNRDLLYFVLSIMILFWHSTVIYSYDFNTLNINKATITIVELLSDCLPKVAIPLFFFFSGLLFWNRVNNLNDVKNKMIRRVKTILIPYVVWSILFYIFLLVLDKTNYATEYLSTINVPTLSLKSFFDAIFLYKYNQDYWYLAQLIVFFALSPIVYFIFKNKKIAIAFLITIFVLYACGITLPINVYFTPYTYSYIYYFIGTYIGIHSYERFIDFCNNENRSRLWEIVLSFVVYFFGSIARHYIGIRGIANVIAYIVTSFCFLMFFVGVSRKAKSREIYSYYLIIYVFQFAIQPLLNKTLCNILPQTSFGILANLFIGVFATLLIIVAFCHICKKYLTKIWPFLSGEFTK